MKLIAATKNKGKLVEFSRIFRHFGIEVLSMQEAGVDIDVKEMGTTFAENAALKAKTIYEATGLATVADDSGLCIDALAGRPGVYSARYGGEDTPYPEKIRMLLSEMEQVPDDRRTAYFESAICCVLGSERVIECSGRCYGTIAKAPKGENGFGYDPIFVIDGESFAEMSDEKKDANSHRGMALRILFGELEKQLG